MADTVVEAPYAGPTPADEWRDRLGRPLLRAAVPFYRRYPYRGPVSIFFLNLRGAYSGRDRVFYNRVPKAANSTVMRILLENSAYRDEAGDRHYKKALPGHLRMSSGEVRALAAGEYFRFTVVRNPYARVLSAYKDKILLRRRQLGRFASQFETPPGEIPDFTQFCRFLDRGGLFRDAHWAPQTDLMLLPIAEFDLVGKVETLERDLGFVLERLGRPALEAGPPRANATTPSGTPAALYTDEAREIVRRLYGRDFSAFGYDPDVLPG